MWKDLVVGKTFFYKFPILEISEPHSGQMWPCKHCILAEVWKQYQSANQPRQNGINAFECVFDTPISYILAKKFSDCFLFHLVLFSGSLATSCCQNADKNKMAELWTLVIKVNLSFHTYIQYRSEEQGTLDRKLSVSVLHALPFLFFIRSVPVLYPFYSVLFLFC